MVESAAQSAAAQQLQENASSKRLFFDLFAILALAAQARLAFFSEALGTDEIVYLTRAQHILHGEYPQAFTSAPCATGSIFFLQLQYWSTVLCQGQPRVPASLPGSLGLV
jgi:hypothetical protein